MVGLLEKGLFLVSSHGRRWRDADGEGVGGETKADDLTDYLRSLKVLI